MHRLVAFFALVVHLFFVAFTVVGGFLAWLIPGLAIPHIAAALWGGKQAATRDECPLSNLENWGREGSGRPPLREGGFIVHYFHGRVYPVRWARPVEVVAGGLIIGSWLGLALR